MLKVQIVLVNQTDRGQGNHKLLLKGQVILQTYSAVISDRNYLHLYHILDPLIRRYDRPDGVLVVVGFEKVTILCGVKSAQSIR